MCGTVLALQLAQQQTALHVPQDQPQLVLCARPATPCLVDSADPVSGVIAAAGQCTAACNDISRAVATKPTLLSSDAQQRMYPTSTRLQWLHASQAHDKFQQLANVTRRGQIPLANGADHIC